MSILITETEHLDSVVRLEARFRRQSEPEVLLSDDIIKRMKVRECSFTARHLNDGMKDKRFEDFSKSYTRNTVQRRPNSTHSMKLSSARLFPLAPLAQTLRALEQALSLLPSRQCRRCASGQRSGMHASHADRRRVIHLLGLGCLIGLRAEIGCCGTALRKISGEDRLDEGAEDDLSTAACLVSRKGSLHRTTKPTQSWEGPSTEPSRT